MPEGNAQKPIIMNTRVCCVLSVEVMTKDWAASCVGIGNIGHSGGYGSLVNAQPGQL